MSQDLSVQLAPNNKRRLSLANPVMTASGTFGYGIEYADIFDIQQLGAIVCKGTTINPREGNPQPRLYETACGMLNSIGLQNIGAATLIKDKAPIWAKWSVPVIVNIAGETVDDYGKLAGMLDKVEGISGLEVNISCPNVKEGGASFGANPETAASVTRTVKEASSLPVLVKLTPNLCDINHIAEAVTAAGADALTLINCPKGMAIDIKERRLVLGNIHGGLSGPAIKPMALAMVYEIAGIVSIPIIGCGGIYSATDAIEFIMAGASAVQIGSATFVNPCAAIEILEGIKGYLQNEGIANIRDIIGAARR